MTKKTKNIWDVASKLYVYRRPPLTVTQLYSVERIDPGVNFFVLLLEQLGAVPFFSCEGHPNGFYVLFESAQKLAERIHACGFFTVELEGHNRWSIRMRAVEDARDRRKVLRWAADAWEKNLEPLNLRKAKAQKVKSKKKTNA